jgi:hypothetical protein
MYRTAKSRDATMANRSTGDYSAENIVQQHLHLINNVRNHMHVRLRLNSTVHCSGDENRQKDGVDHKSQIAKSSVDPRGQKYTIYTDSSLSESQVQNQIAKSSVDPQGQKYTIYTDSSLSESVRGPRSMFVSRRVDSNSMDV